MIALGSMAFSDYIILLTLTQLLDEGRDGAIISQEMISHASGVPLITTQRALKRLMRSGKIEGSFRIGIGYQYRVNSDNGSTGTTTA